MIRLALERPISTLIAAATLVTLGIFSLLRLPVSLLPSIEKPRLVIVATSEARSREQMLHGMTEPLERRLSSLAGITSIRSETEDGVSRIFLETGWNHETDALLIEATRKVEGAGDFAPSELTVSSSGGDLSPIVEISVTGGGSAASRSAFAQKVLLPDLTRLEGAGRVEMFGARPLHAVVRPLAAALASRALTPHDVVERLRDVGQSLAAGRVRDGAAVRPLVIREPVGSLEALGRVEIAAGNGSVPLSDVARISLEEVGDETSFRVDGADAVLLAIYRAPGANAVALARRIDQRVGELQERSGAGMRLEIVRDSSREVVSALRELALAAFAGILLGTLVLRIMLGRWMPTLALSLVIPASLLSAFSAFYFFSIPIDVISLAGLALAAGMLVDNSIVVLEAIESARSTGAKDAPLHGVRQVAKAVVASTITTVVVFLPLIYLHGVARAFFGEQAFAVVTTLAASLLFSLTLTPVLSGRTESGGETRSPGLATYRRTLDAAMRSPRRVVVVSILAIAVALTSSILLRRELFPRSTSRAIEIEYQLPHELSAEEADRRARSLERWVAKEVGAARVLARRGLAENRTAALGETMLPTRGLIEIELESAAEARQAEAILAERFRGTAGVRATVAPRPSAFVETLGSRKRGIEIIATAPDETRAERLADRLQRSVRERFHVDVALEQTRLERPMTILRWDDARLAELGSSRDAMVPQLRSALGRLHVGKIDIEGVEPQIWVAETSPSELANLPIAVPSASSRRVVPLAALARAETRSRPSRFDREQQRPAVRLLVAADRRVDAFDLANHLQSLSLASDESVRLGGEALELDEAFSQLRLALLLSVLLVFLTLAATYESFLLPLLIMTTVPVAAGGGFFALALFGQTLNIMSLIAFILLGGIVVNNAIVLVDRIEQLGRRGEPIDGAIQQAAGERYRPILMTTATTALGMLPLALLGGEGVELRRALAIAVLGGLATSTFASLLLVPILHRASERFRRNDPRRAATAEEAA